jgi:hypothetical protein
MGFRKLTLGGHQLSIETFDDVAGLIVALVNLLKMLLHLFVELVFFFCQLVGQAFVFV